MLSSSDLPLISGNIKIGTVAASGKLSWSLLDGLVERLFSEYLMLVDPVTNLGLAAESVKSYNIGEIVRRPQESREPELLPYGYIIGHINTITVSLSDTSSPHVDILAFDTLIPKSIMQRYVALVGSLRVASDLFIGCFRFGNTNMSSFVGLLPRASRAQL